MRLMRLLGAHRRVSIRRINNLTVSTISIVSIVSRNPYVSTLSALEKPHGSLTGDAAADISPGGSSFGREAG